MDEEEGGVEKASSWGGGIPTPLSQVHILILLDLSSSEREVSYTIEVVGLKGGKVGLEGGGMLEEGVLLGGEEDVIGSILI